ncbi:specifically androgen-regulated gene protein [Lampris incognitus]|uniref:specifically androgen-regulated gene protein n=1 Tax=Lampris incognitus TaxID=2546036 RepID=UPI0024B4BEE9|nr:specifically androgen-regulated gene protein [Lampris incognitus]
MPKSDTWPGGTGFETITTMDSAGSCDSVVSANSGFSDGSLEHLSAEERACLMFLEETIESLDTEDDSGLSNDEPDQLPTLGNLATKMANLSASMSNSKLNGTPKCVSKEPIKESFKNNKHIQSYLVPTPLVVANSSSCTVSNAKPSIVPADQNKNFHSKPQITNTDSKIGSKFNQQHSTHPVPSEVNVVVIPPPIKPKDYSGRMTDGSSPRGPLSYEALVHLRRSASVKKSPLCPTIDHTIDLGQHPHGSTTGVQPNTTNLFRAPSKASTHRPMTSPPVVAPKPKRITPSISVNSVLNPNETATPTHDSSSCGKRLPDDQKVRMEALQKLGLLKDKEPEKEAIVPLAPSKSPSSWDSTYNRFARDPAHTKPLRSPSFSHFHVPTEPKGRPVQSSASFHHYSRSEQHSASLSNTYLTNGVKAVTLEGSEAGFGNHLPCQPREQPHSTTLGSHRSCSETAQTKALDPQLLECTTTTQPLSRKSSNLLGYSVIMVPGMGADRREALKKLGLLKE